MEIMEADYTIMTKEELQRRINYDKELLLLPTMYDKMNEMVAQDRIQCEKELQNRNTKNFKIVENDYSVWDNYDLFKEMYYNHLEITKQEIKERLKLSESQYTTLLKECMNETGLKRQGTLNKIVPVSKKDFGSNFWDKYAEFEELYLHDFTIVNAKSLREILNLNLYEYNQLRGKCINRNKRKRTSQFDKLIHIKEDD